MSASVLIAIVLLVLIAVSLPMWKYTRMWGGTYTPAIFIGCVLAAHVYTMIF